MARKFSALILSVLFVFALLSELGSTQAAITELASPNKEASGHFGFSVSGVPDMNGDGLGEIVIGAYQEDPGSSPAEAGRAYIFDGATRAHLRTLASPNEEEDGSFGQSVSGVPDVNGDGCGDVVVGALNEDPFSSPTDVGRAYIFDGSTGHLLHTLVSPNQESGGNFGNSVSGVSDVNGDGRGDVVVGAPNESPGASPFEAGRVYIFDGSSGLLLRTLSSLNQEASGNFGYSVSGVPDVNGDGRGEVVVGADHEDPGTSPFDVGRAYIFDGSTGLPLQTLNSPNEEEYGQFGISVSGVLDVNGDGRGDIVVGAHREDPGTSPTEAGRAHIFDGSTGLPLQTLASPKEETFGLFGISVSGVPDINQDGRGDVVVGAVWEDFDTEKFDAGIAYIFDGSNGLLIRSLVSPNKMVQGEFGYSVSGASDVDGDGRGDVIVAALGEGPIPIPGGEGRAYVFTGDPEIDVSPTSLSFGSHEINVGQTGSMIATISNDGLGILNFTGAGIEITGTDASEFLITNNPSTSGLLQDTTREIEVAFDPASIGGKSANLSITTNDPDESTVNVSLSGMG